MKNTTLIKITGYGGFLLILLYLFYFLREMDASLIYFWQQSVPLPFSESIQRPGGLSTLMGDLFLESLTGPFRGSMSVVLLVATVFLSFKVIFRQRRSLPVYFAFILAALIPFILYFTNYRLPANLLLSMVNGLLLASIQSLYTPRNLWSRSAFNFITAILVYFVSGVAGLLILFQVLLIRSEKIRDLASALPVLVIPMLYMLFDVSVTVKTAYLGSFLISEFNVLSPVIFFCLGTPTMLFVIFTFWKYLTPVLKPNRPMLLSGISTALVIAVLVLSSRASINEREKDAFTIMRAGLQKDADTVIELSLKQDKISNLEQFEFNRALYRKGLLLDELFKYPQPWGEKGIFLEKDYSSPRAIYISDFNMDLGFANEARHWATEAQMGFMRHPVVLKNLVISYVAMGRNKAAFKYLRVLSGSRLYKDWCDQIYEMIENKTSQEDPRIKPLIINNPEINFFCSTTDPSRKLLDFYRCNPDNIMAFEYLIASYLLQHEVGKVVPYLPKFKEFGYKKLPRAVEEAMLIYATSSKADLEKVKGFSTSQTTLKDFKELTRLMSGKGTRAERMHRASKYEHTYWYYILFTSPNASKN